MVTGALAFAAAGLPRAVRGASCGAACAGSFKTVLKKALIRPRLTPDVVKVLKDNGYPGVELQDKKVKGPREAPGCDRHGQAQPASRGGLRRARDPHRAGPRGRHQDAEAE